MSNLLKVELSVIIASFNDGAMLLEAVESAELNQNGCYEIIVINDGSTDPVTLEILTLLVQRGIQVIHQKNAGPAAARNTGVRQAVGAYILPLDADNRLRPAYIDRGIHILHAQPTVDVVYGDLEYFGDKTGRRRIPEFNFSRMLLGNYIDTCAVFRKAAWERVGGFDERIPRHGIEDWDFWIRLGAGGSRFHHVDEVLFDYRVRAGSLSAHLWDQGLPASVQKYMDDKVVATTLGEFRKALTWDFVVEAFRLKPFKTVVGLISRAFLPGLRRWWLQRRP